MQPLEELPFIAGDPALDFVNTAEERGHPDAGDVLVSPAALAFWGRRYGLLSSSVRPASAADGMAELERAREARELLYGIFLACAQGRPPAARDLDRLAALAAEAHAAGTLRRGADGRVIWRWSPAQLATVRHVALTSAVDLLAAAPGPRLKQCPGDRCGWFFLDATKRGNRRWCLMSECGQDAKEARRRERRKRGATG